MSLAAHCEPRCLVESSPVYRAQGCGQGGGRAASSVYCGARVCGAHRGTHCATLRSNSRDESVDEVRYAHAPQTLRSSASSGARPPPCPQPCNQHGWFGAVSVASKYPARDECSVLPPLPRAGEGWGEGQRTARRNAPSRGERCVRRAGRGGTAGAGQGLRAARSAFVIILTAAV